MTPFSAILADLEENYHSNGDPWKLTRTRSFNRQRTLARRVSSSSTRVNSFPHDQAKPTEGEGGLDTDKDKENLEKQLGVQYLRRNQPGEYGVRRVDFHWSVRERNDLLVRSASHPPIQSYRDTDGSCCM